MFQHFLKISWRNLSKHQFYTTINLLGLIIGMTATMLIADKMGFDISYDDFHENKNNIYQVYHEESINGVLSYKGNYTFAGTGMVAKQFTAVQQYTRLTFAMEQMIIPEGGVEHFNEDRIYQADSSFLNIFSFNAIEGNPNVALRQPGTSVITEATAIKLFGTPHALGKKFTSLGPWGDKQTYKVTCILENLPENSHLQFNILLSTEPLKEGEWGEAVHMTYFLLDELTSVKAFTAALNRHIEERMNTNNLNRFVELGLIPLQEIAFKMGKTSKACILSWTNHDRSPHLRGINW